MNITVVICAYNAAGTLLNAINSVDVPECPILIINDDSKDNTLELLEKYDSKQVKIVSHKKNKGLSTARQTALNHIRTDYGIWLDADDEFLPGRIMKLYHYLDKNDYDLVFDQAELWDGHRQIKIRDLPIPDFILNDQSAYRLFERNYLPVPACPAFRVSTARKIGYDITRRQSEDYDFNLRAIRGGLRLHLIRFTGYKLNAYDSSLSRNLNIQGELTCKTLKKFTLEEIQKIYLDFGCSEKITQWALVLVSINKSEPKRAFQLLNNMESECKNNFDILELDGPLPFPENWKWYFYCSISQLMLSKYHNAVTFIEKALEIKKSPELFNNLGFAFGKINGQDGLKDFFKKAQELNSKYNDAVKNEKAHSTEELTFTKHPLRCHPSRMEYNN